MTLDDYLNGHLTDAEGTCFAKAVIALGVRRVREFVLKDASVEEMAEAVEASIRANRLDKRYGVDASVVIRHWKEFAAAMEEAKTAGLLPR